MSRRLLLSYLALTVVLLAALEIPLAVNHNDRLRTDLTSDLVRDAYSMAGYAEETVEGTADVDLALLARSYEERTGGRVVIADRTGHTLADSHPDASSETFASRPEVALALTGVVATGTRYSETLGSDLLYVAVPIATSSGIEGALRITYSTAQIDQRRRDYLMTLVGVAVVSLLVATLLGLLLARWVTRPIRRLERAAADLGAGELRVRADEASGPPELRDLARTFNAMADRLDTLMASQAGFVADASHQLRSPLAALQLQLENLQADLGAPGTLAPRVASFPAPPGAAAADDLVAEDIDAALAETARLGRIVDALLVLARADRAARSPLATAPAPLEVDHLLDDRVATWATVAEDREVRLRAEPSGLGVAADADVLAQVVDNLLANAIDASPRGSTVLLRADAVDARQDPDRDAGEHGGQGAGQHAGQDAGQDRREDRGRAPGAGGEESGGDGGPSLVELHVVDGGPGLTAEERGRAFDRFWRGDQRPSELGGTGLGLPIARQLARSMGGDVVLREAPGGGVDAVVRLRAARPGG